LGSFCALLGRGPNAGDAFGSLRALFGFGRNCNGDAGNAGAGDPRTDGGRALTSSSESKSDNSSLAASIAFTFAFAFALACSTNGANSLSNSKSEDSSGVDLSELESLELSLF